MCRMIGAISVKNVDAERYLLRSECSLFMQAVKGRQGDGWGIAWYIGGSPKMVKSEKPVYEETNEFEKVVRDISTNALIAHVRKASNPRNLPREMIIGLNETQPFQYRNRVFAHNGVIRVPDEAMSLLGNYRRLVRGNNDSEVYFALLMKEWDKLGEVSKALRAVEETLQKALEDSRKNYENPFSSLNAIFSDGKKLYTYNRFSDEEKILSLKSVCYKDSPYYTMTYMAGENELVISSERLWKNDEWKLLGNGFLMTAWMEHGEIRYSIESIID